jgi:hypothetical protein
MEQGCALVSEASRLSPHPAPLTLLRYEKSGFRRLSRCFCERLFAAAAAAATTTESHTATAAATAAAENRLHK